MSDPLLPNSDGPIEEYQLFKSYVLNHWRALGSADFTRVALSNHFVRTSCPTSHKLLLIAATLPMTSVECERTVFQRAEAGEDGFEEPTDSQWKQPQLYRSRQPTQSP